MDHTVRGDKSRQHRCVCNIQRECTVIIMCSERKNKEKKKQLETKMEETDEGIQKS